MKLDRPPRHTARAPTGNGCGPTPSTTIPQHGGLDPGSRRVRAALRVRRVVLMWGTPITCPACACTNIHLHAVQVDAGDGSVFSIVAGEDGHNGTVAGAVLPAANLDRGSAVSTWFSCEGCGADFADVLAFYKGETFGRVETVARAGYPNCGGTDRWPDVSGSVTAIPIAETRSSRAATSATRAGLKARYAGRRWAREAELASEKRRYARHSRKYRRWLDAWSDDPEVVKAICAEIVDFASQAQGPRPELSAVVETERQATVAAVTGYGMGFEPSMSTSRRFGDHTRRRASPRLPQRHREKRAWSGPGSRRDERVPGLLTPIHDVTGAVRTFQYRPDHPTATAAGRTVKSRATVTGWCSTSPSPSTTSSATRQSRCT